MSFYGVRLLASLRQYLPKKPKKWGFKVFARCSVSGLKYNFHMYDGKGPDVVESCGFQSADFVMKLCETARVIRDSKISQFISITGLPVLSCMFCWSHGAYGLLTLCARIVSETVHWWLTKCKRWKAEDLWTHGTKNRAYGLLALCSRIVSETVHWRLTEC